MTNRIEFKPQPGPQEMFMSTPADIAIYGGAAGSGKSFALLMEPLRYSANGKFGGVIFRRNTTQVRNEGGLWHESMDIYPLFRAKPREAFLEWIFPSGMRVKFSHLEHDYSVHNWQGSQIPFIGFDELTHFTESQFWYMFSRNRSMSNVPGYIRATCNPDPDSFVRTLIDWWIGEDGYPIQERSGKIRYFVRLNDSFIWADTKEEIYTQYGNVPEVQPKSFTFISANIRDNKILMDKDPAYLSNLLALDRVERLRLLGGNWNVRASAGMMFNRDWFPMVDAIPGGFTQLIRFWDRASTKPNELNRDPDWTRGMKLYMYPDNTFVVGDLKSCRDTPYAVEQLVRTTASQDTISCAVGTDQDPGSAGVNDITAFSRMMAGYDVRIGKPTENKVTRARPVSAQCEVGNIRVLRAPWNDEFFRELENFSEEMLGHDDIVDAFSGAFNTLAEGGISICDAYSRAHGV